MQTWRVKKKYMKQREKSRRFMTFIRVASILLNILFIPCYLSLNFLSRCACDSLLKHPQRRIHLSPSIPIDCLCQFRAQPSGLRQKWLWRAYLMTSIMAFAYEFINYMPNVALHEKRLTKRHTATANKSARLCAK